MVGYSPYLLTFGRDPIFQSRIQHFEKEELDPATAATQPQVFLGRRGQTFREVMPQAMRNLAIAYERDKRRYKLVHESGWDHPRRHSSLVTTYWSNKNPSTR